MDSGRIIRTWLIVVVTSLQMVKIDSWSTPRTTHCNFSRHSLQSSTTIPSSTNTFCKIMANTVIPRWYRHPTYLSSQPDNHDDGLTMSQFPEPLVWLWSPTTEQDDWKSVSELTLLPAAIRTWNWSKDFVLRLNLCPWAKGSLETPSAMQIFVVPKDQEISYSTGSYANDICHSVAQKCLQYCQDYPEMESSIIFFVVFQEEDVDADCDVDIDDPDRMSAFHGFYDQWESFVEFHEWFMDLEDGWEMDDIIVAPFHPHWQFGGDGPSTLDFEKKSPYPTVTFVSTKVVEQAGEGATAQIAQKNEETLGEKSLDDLEEQWDDSSSSSPSMPW